MSPVTFCVVGFGGWLEQGGTFLAVSPVGAFGAPLFLSSPGVTASMNCDAPADAPELACFGVEGLGLIVWGSVFGIWGLGSGVSGSGCLVSGFWSRVSCFGVTVQGL